MYFSNYSASKSQRHEEKKYVKYSILKTVIGVTAAQVLGLKVQGLKEYSFTTYKKRRDSNLEPGTLNQPT